MYCSIVLEFPFWLDVLYITQCGLNVEYSFIKFFYTDKYRSTTTLNSNLPCNIFYIKSQDCHVILKRVLKLEKCSKSKRKAVEIKRLFSSDRYDWEMQHANFCLSRFIRIQTQWEYCGFHISCRYLNADYSVFACYVEVHADDSQ
jgi:hypothetical protein